MLTVDEMDSLGDLTSHRLVWRSLLSRTPNASVLQSREWFEQSFANRPAGSRPCVLTICSQGRPVGLLPMVVQPRTTGVGTLRVLSYADSRAPGLLGPQSTATLTAAFRYLATQSDRWDMLDLRGIAPLVDRGRTTLALRRADLSPFIRSWPDQLRVDLSRRSAADVYVSRNRLKLAERRLWQQGRWQHSTDAPSDLACSSLIDPLWEMATSHLAPGDEFDRARLEQSALVALEQQALGVQMLWVQGHIAGCVLYAQLHRRVDVLAFGAATSEARDVLLGRFLYGDTLRHQPEVHLPESLADATHPWRAEPLTTLRLTHFATSSSRSQLLRVARWVRRDTLPASTSLPRFADDRREEPDAARTALVSVR